MNQELITIIGALRKEAHSQRRYAIQRHGSCNSVPYSQCHNIVRSRLCLRDNKGGVSCANCPMGAKDGYVDLYLRWPTYE